MSKNNYDVGDSLWYFYVDREKRLPYQIDKSGIGVIVCRDYSTAKMAIDIARTLPNWRAVIDISADSLGWRFLMKLSIASVQNHAALAITIRNCLEMAIVLAFASIATL